MNDQTQFLNVSPPKAIGTVSHYRSVVPLLHKSKKRTLYECLKKAYVKSDNPVFFIALLELVQLNDGAHDFTMARIFKNNKAVVVLHVMLGSIHHRISLEVSE